MAYTTLPVKYRPKQWDDIVGQKDIVTRMKGMLKTGKVTQSLLFVGSHGTGKTTCAKMLARYLNCEKSSACGKCDSCLSVENHPDVTELNAGADGGIDSIRKIIQEAKYKPSLGKYRIILMDECHKLTNAAVNALLVPLEEPPANTIYILCSMEPDKLDGALISRCSRFEFVKPERSDIAKRILAISKKEKADYIDEKTAKILAENSDGHVRDAIAFLEAVIQYVDGSDEKDVAKAVKPAIKAATAMSDDSSAMKTLIALYKGSSKSLHNAILDVQDYNQFLNKISYFNMYALDSFLASGHSRVWHTENNKKFVALCAKNVEGFDSDFVPKLLQVQDALNSIKVDMGAFLLKDRDLISTKLGMLLQKIKK